MSLRVGLMAVPDAEPERVAELAMTAESSGFDFLACGEHIFFNGGTMNAFVALSAAAAVTERIRLLSAVTIAPLYPPGLLAKMATTLERVSQGRFDLGVGVGGEFPAEFAACGVPVAERGARTDEILEVCGRLFAGEALSYEGRFSRFVGERLDPLPFQGGSLPIWVGGRRSAATRRAGRYGDYWMPYFVSPEQFATTLHDARTAAEDHGRPRDAVAGALFAWAMAADEPAVARTAVSNRLSLIYRQDLEPVIDRYVPVGTPAQVAARLAEYVEAGADAIVLSPACEPNDLSRVIRVFSEEIVPLLRDADRARHAATDRSAT